MRGEERKKDFIRTALQETKWCNQKGEEREQAIDWKGSGRPGTQLIISRYSRSNKGIKVSKNYVSFFS